MRQLTTLMLGICLVASFGAAPLAAQGNPLLESVISTANDMVEAGSRDAIDSQEQQGGSGTEQGAGGSPEGGGAEGEEGEEVQDNGTNPASFGFKFMPYYRYTELNNEVKSIEDLVLFALIDLPMISPFSALVLEWPVRKTMDFGSLAENFLVGIQEIPLIPCAPPTCGGDLPAPPPEAIARGFDISGVGDFRLRYLQGIKMIPGEKPGRNTVLMVGLDVMTPAASDPILGDETWYGSPIFAHIHNLDPTSFFAFLHFYFFDWAEKSGADPINQNKDIGFYMGRFFFQKAWPKLGYYLLPELQVIYDNESANDWSVMFMPELGKSFAAGNLGLTAYIKPGWAIDGPDPAERRFSVEFGIRMIPAGK